MKKFVIPMKVDDIKRIYSLDENEIKKHSSPKDGFVEGIDFNNSFKKNIKFNKYDLVFANLLIDNFYKNRNLSKSNLNVIDLFCGAGGSSLGFKLAGFNLVGALDINAKAAKTHEVNFPGCKTIVGDITKISPKEFHKMIGNKKIDVLIGSPPCQTFSSLSQGKIKSLGKDIAKDVRNYFYKFYLDYVIYFSPEFFLMENVPGFQTKFNGAIFDDYLKLVQEKLPEYEIDYKVLDAKNFSVPQSRRRFFVCGRKKKYSFAFPVNNYDFCSQNKNIVTVEEAFSDLPLIADDWRLEVMPYSSNPVNKYQLFMRGKNMYCLNNVCRISNPEAKVLFSKLQPGEKYVDLPPNKRVDITLFDNFDSKVIQGRCHRLPLHDVSWTVIAHIGMDGYEYIHPTQCRTISIREAARLQSFPDDFVFIGNMREQYVQIGNAVPPVLSYSIAREIFKKLQQ